MANFVKAHGLTIAANGFVQNMVVEAFANTAHDGYLVEPAAPADAGRIWFNVDDKVFRVTELDGSDAVIKRTLISAEELASQVAAHGSAKVGYDGQTGANAQFSLVASPVDAALDSIVTELDAFRQAFADFEGAGFADLQNEVDAIETAIGGMISGTGAFVQLTGTNYLNSVTTDMTDVVKAIDTQMKADADALAAELLARDAADDAIQAELDATQTGAGLAADGDYIVDAIGTTYITAATSLANADHLLDVALKAEADARVAGDDALDARLDIIETTGLGNIQDEVDAIELASGLEVNGTLGAWVTPQYLTATTLKGGIEELDDTLKAHADAAATDKADVFVWRDGTKAMTGDLAMANHTITGVLDPISPLQAANKQYVDLMAQGLNPHAPAQAATTANIALDGSVTVVDGVTLAEGDRVLVKNQTDLKENGIYVVGVDALTAWTVADDADGTPAGEFAKGTYVYVEAGTAQEATGWVLASENPVTVGVSDITFVQFSSAGLIVAGIGLSKAGNVLSIGLGAGIKELPDDMVGVDYSATGGLTLTDETATGQLMIKLDGTSLELSADGLKVGTGGAIGTLQTEVDAIETAAGLAANGTFVAHSGTNYIDAATTMFGVDVALDTAIKAEVDARVAAIAQEVTDRDAAIAAEATLRDAADDAIQAELDATQAAAGLEANGSLAAWASTYYLDNTPVTGDLTVKAGIEKLDASLNALATGGSSTQTELDALEVALGGMIAGATGNYVAFTTSNYMNAATTVTGAMSALDTQLKTVTDGLATEITDRTADVDAEETRAKGIEDAIIAAVGLTTGTGALAAWVGTAHYIGGTTTFKSAVETLDAQVYTEHERISTEITDRTTADGVLQDAIDALEDAIDGGKYSETTTTAATQHVITHSLASFDVSVDVWVADPNDSNKWKNDLVGITLTDNNTVTIDLTESRNIKILVEKFAPVV